VFGNANELHLLMTSGLVMFAVGMPYYFRVLLVIAYHVYSYVFPTPTAHTGYGVSFICAGLGLVY
jgi:hypothetical protein